MTDIASKTAAVATYGGSASAIFFGLAANEFGTLCGVAIGVIGLAANIYYKQQHLNIARKNNNPDKEE